MPTQSQYTTSHLLVAPDKLESAAAAFIRQKWDIDSTTYPHITWIGDEESTLKIAEVRALKTEASFATNAQSPRYFVLLGIDTATQPAQNALLKLVEEPPLHTQFLLVARTTTPVLPTIISRCSVVQSSPSEFAEKTSPSPDVVELYTALTTGSLANALTTAEQYTNREKALQITSQLILVVHDQLQKNPHNETVIAHLQILMQLHTRLLHNGMVQLVVEDAFMALLDT